MYRKILILSFLLIFLLTSACTYQDLLGLNSSGAQAVAQQPSPTQTFTPVPISSGSSSSSEAKIQEDDLKPIEQNTVPTVTAHTYRSASGRRARGTTGSGSLWSGYLS